MNVERVDRAHEFFSRAQAWLMADEARHTLILGLAQTLVDHPERYPEHRCWLALDEDGNVSAAALQTLPWNVALARPRDGAALGALARTLASESGVPGLTGARPEVDDCAAGMGRKASTTTGMRLLALDRVLHRGAARGSFRFADAADRKRLIPWWTSFMREALPAADIDAAAMAAAVDWRLRDTDGGIALWVDAEPVAFAAYGGPTPSTIRIGPVYTPPELRGHGYATALVAALSQSLLDGGRRLCLLYTDATNPSSNAIYERIGYRFVCDAADIRFAPP